MKSHARSDGSPLVEQLPLIESTKFLGQMGGLGVNACKDEDPETFHPGTGPQAQLKIDAAKLVCSKCVINLSCLNYALSDQEATGIWGGKTESERKEIRRNIPRARMVRRANV